MSTQVNTQAHPGAAVYAAALDGLQLDDPVAAFFNFCKEREAVRKRRESGVPGPWSEDVIFQKARFLNVFREDDRVTKAIFRFVQPVASTGNLCDLVQAVFFARWCNRDTTLDMLSPELLKDPAALKEALQKLPEPPWCNETAYPVEPVTWDGVKYERFEAATELFGKIAACLVQEIESGKGDVHKATEAVNAKLAMGNDFPIFMAVMDIAWFRPDVVDPASPVPIGIGAVAFAARLKQHLGLQSDDETFQRMIDLQPEYWPEAKRKFQPIDIEYLTCECRKYYSYVNGTKTFEGKNAFTPGGSPTPAADVDALKSNTKVPGISGSDLPAKRGLKRRVSCSPSGRELPTPVRQQPLSDNVECKECVPEMKIAAALSTKRTDYLAWDDYFMSVARLSAMRSKDPSTQVGACIVNSENKIVGIGYNGFPAGCHDDDLPWGRESSNPLETKYMYVCHAEMNAILNRIASDTKGCRMYVDLFPCNECAKLIIQSGIHEVIYMGDKYHDQPAFVASRRLMDCAGITYRQHVSSRKITIDLNTAS